MLGQSYFCKDSPVAGTKFVPVQSKMKLMLSPRYDESSCQSYGLLYHLIGPANNCKS